MKKKDIILLDKSLFIGKGANMEVYINPKNQKQCIKVRIGNLQDYYREMTYRKSRQRRKRPRSVLMTDYFGTVETNLGTGYVFEHVADYDGITSKTIHDLVQLELQAREKGISVKEFTGSEKEFPCVMDVLLRFQRILFQEKIIMHDLGPWNYMVQFDTPTDWKVRIVDSFGIRGVIHILYYFDSLEISHCRRFWLRFINAFTTREYPGFFTEQEIERLKNLV